jgi:hypothetical protein
MANLRQLAIISISQRQYHQWLIENRNVAESVMAAAAIEKLSKNNAKPKPALALWRLMAIWRLMVSA